MFIKRTSIFKYTKPESFFVARSQSEHLLNLTKKCVARDYKHPSANQKTPLSTC